MYISDFYFIHIMDVYVCLATDQLKSVQYLILYERRENTRVYLYAH